MPEFDISLYNDEFFEWHVKYAREYSIKTMDWYIDTFVTKSVVDFGCGIGSYLQSAFFHKLEIKGYEISNVARKYTEPYIRDFIEYRDCTEPIQTKKYDTVLSFETAEHIRPEGTEQFVNNILNAVGKHLLFTAAPPGQQGTGHINLRPREFWIEQFTKRLKYDQGLTKDISDNWRILGAPNYICDNLIVCTR